MMAPRILLCGDVLGRLDMLSKRLASVIKSNGSFDALFCVGQFFPETVDASNEMKQYIEGTKELPLITYFIGDYGVGSDSLLSSAKANSLNEGFRMEGIPVGRNIFWLKGSGKFTVHGLSIVYLAGRNQFSGPALGTYSEDNIDALRVYAEESGIVDLFLTNEWPQGLLNSINSEDKCSELEHVSKGNLVISELAAELKPRYHIAGSEGVYFVRQPFKNDGAAHVTRFIGLASIGNDKKQKFIHALSPTPGSLLSLNDLSVVPANSTPSPYKFLQQSSVDKGTQKRPEVSESQYWRYSISQKRQRTSYAGQNDIADGAGYTPASGVCFEYLKKGRCHKGDNCRFSHDVDSGKKMEQCWFCLSGPNINSHLIVSIGDHFYCALPKGPLVEDHLLLIPVEHFPSALSLSSDAERELEKYKNAMKQYFKEHDKATVTFERNLNSRSFYHMHLQVVPIPLAKASLLKDEFMAAGRKLGFEFDVIRPADGDVYLKTHLKSIVNSHSEYFFVELPEGTILVHPLEGKEKMPMQFGREVLANILGIPEKIDWRDCQVNKDEEASMAEAFKKRFAKFIPNDLKS